MSSDSATEQLSQNIIHLNQLITKFNNTLNLDAETRDLGIDFLYDSLSLANEVFIEKSSIGSPSFVDWISPTRKVAGDNPWTRYQSTMLKGDSTYEIQGNIGNIIYMGVQVYSLRNGRNIALPEKNVSTPNINTDAKGNFRLSIGPDPSNDIKIDTNDYMLIIREYYANGEMRNKKPAQYQIIQKSGDFDTPFIPSPAIRVAKANAFFTSLVTSTLDLTGQMGTDKNQSVDVNPNPDLVHALFPTTDNTYDGFYIHLNDDNEVLQLTGKIPSDLIYASVTYYNPYYVTADYIKHKTYLTKDEIKPNQDGSYTIYIAKKNLQGVKNVMTTAGYSDGVIAIRYLGQEAKGVEIDFDTQLIKVDEIPAEDLN
ncbi:MAG TPA: hypothetical protein DD638_06185 [Pasteurellaceae bacterium]|nr:hypothetical protein [Pasteurellaceae bacterium]